MEFITTHTRLTFGLAACMCIALFFAIGFNGDAWPVLMLNHYFGKWNSNGLQIEIAWILTSSGFLPQLGALAVIALVGGLLKRTWLERAIFAIALDLFAWIFTQCVHLALVCCTQNRFADVQQKLNYASGHAVHAMLVFGVWAFFFGRSSLPEALRISISALLCTWMLGVSWSRLALGVHSTSDIIGGWLLALALICAGFAVYPRVLRAV